MNDSSVAVVIITKNETKNIRACLETAKWADEIVILDDESTDDTVTIAKEFTNKIFHRKMDIEGTHRNYAYSKATTRWVLSLDADERITPELAAEIRKVLANPGEQVAYAIPIKAFIGQTWIQGAGYYPARKVRLFQKDKFRYEDARVHPRVFIDGKCGALNGDILHFSYRNFEDLFRKFNRETTLEADKWVKQGRKVGLLEIWRKSISRFLKFYFQKKGYKYGFLGFFFSYLHALYQFVSYVKFWEAMHLKPNASNEKSEEQRR